MSTYDPLQTSKRMWNDPDDILKESLAGIMMMHPDLVYIDSCKAVLRRDIYKQTGKVCSFFIAV